jgi:hypothetical protein
MYIADVASLPWPHGLFRCPHKHVFDASIPDKDKDRREDSQPHVEAVARRFSKAQVRRCPYHRPDWIIAAEVAITCWQEARRDDLSDVGEALSQVDLTEETRWAAESFFIEPIWIDGPSLGNGQHRVCAMKLAGVSRCLVEE